jgi:hypothetical protein
MDYGNNLKPKPVMQQKANPKMELMLQDMNKLLAKLRTERGLGEDDKDFFGDVMIDQQNPDLIRWNAELDYNDAFEVAEQLTPLLSKHGYNESIWDAEDSGRWLAHLGKMKGR